MAVSAHKFYLGQKNAGAIMLVVFLFGWIALEIPAAIISTVEGSRVSFWE